MLQSWHPHNAKSARRTIALPSPARIAVQALADAAQLRPVVGDGFAIGAESLLAALVLIEPTGDSQVNCRAGDDGRQGLGIIHVGYSCTVYTRIEQGGKCWNAFNQRIR